MLEGSEARSTARRDSLARAVLTDIQFWIPLGVLAGGLALLVALR